MPAVGERPPSAPRVCVCVCRAARSRACCQHTQPCAGTLPVLAAMQQDRSTAITSRAVPAPCWLLHSCSAHLSQGHPATIMRPLPGILQHSSLHGGAAAAAYHRLHSRALQSTPPLHPLCVPLAASSPPQHSSCPSPDAAQCASCIGCSRSFPPSSDAPIKADCSSRCCHHPPAPHTLTFSSRTGTLLRLQFPSQCFAL